MYQGPSFLECRKRVRRGHPRSSDRSSWRRLLLFVSKAKTLDRRGGVKVECQPTQGRKGLLASSLNLRLMASSINRATSALCAYRKYMSYNSAVVSGFGSGRAYCIERS